MGKTTILGVPFDTYTMNEAADYAVNLLDKNGQHIICTPNPEIVMEAQQDRELMGILKAADMVTPDGVGVVWASKYTKSIISKFEMQRQEPTASNLINIARYFGISVDSLLGISGVHEASVPLWLRKSYERLSVQERKALKLIIEAF